MAHICTREVDLTVDQRSPRSGRAGSHHAAESLVGVVISKACTVFIAVGASPYDDRAEEVIRQPIGTALPELLRRLSTVSDA